MDLKNILLPNNMMTNLKLHKDVVMQGGILYGLVEFKMGKKKQEIDNIVLNVYVSYLKENNQAETILFDTYEVSNKISTYQYEEKTIPFEYTFSKNIPITSSFVTITLEFKINYHLNVPVSIKRKVKIIPSNQVNAMYYVLTNRLSFQPSYKIGLIQDNKQIYEFYVKDSYLHSLGFSEIILEFHHQDYYLYINSLVKINNQHFPCRIATYYGDFFTNDGKLNEESLVQLTYKNFVYEIGKITNQTFFS